MVDLLTILQILDLIGTEINFQTSNNCCHIIVIFPFFKPPENMLVKSPKIPKKRTFQLVLCKLLKVSKPFRFGVLVICIV